MLEFREKKNRKLEIYFGRHKRTYLHETDFGYERTLKTDLHGSSSENVALFRRDIKNVTTFDFNKLSSLILFQSLQTPLVICDTQFIVRPGRIPEYDAKNDNVPLS